MQLKNRIYYFGKRIDKDLVNEVTHEAEKNVKGGWTEPYYYRIVVTDDEEIRFEDTCGRSLPILLSDINSLNNTLFDIRKDISEVLFGQGLPPF